MSETTTSLIREKLRFAGIITHTRWHVKKALAYLESLGYPNMEGAAIREGVDIYVDCVKHNREEIRNTGGREMFLKAIHG